MRSDDYCFTSYAAQGKSTIGDDQARLIKQGMMQQLLTGRIWPVKNDTGASRSDLQEAV